MSDNTPRLIELEINNAPNLRFTGSLVGCVDSKTTGAQRWTVLALYRTTGGKYICYKEGHSAHQGEYTKTSGAVAETPSQVIEFFGHTLLAKSLYSEAQIDDVTIVD